MLLALVLLYHASWATATPVPAEVGCGDPTATDIACPTDAETARYIVSVTGTSFGVSILLTDDGVDLGRSCDGAARLLVPLTRSPGGAALQVEVEFDSLDAFDRYRDQGLGSAGDTRSWIRELSDILLEPPAVELLRSADGPTASQGDQQSGEEPSGERRRGLIGGTVHKA